MADIDVETWLCGPPPSTGQYQRYPSRFLYNLKRKYPEMFDKNALHMFSGSCSFGVSTDIRPETKPDICAPYDKIPRPANSFSAVICDPPYASHYANEWHTDLPLPKRILQEAARLVKPNGLIGILHIIIIPAYKVCNVKRIALHPILTGPNNAIRVFNVFRKGF